MTIRDNTWCEDCQETCTGHMRVCTMCGGDLVAPPSTSNNTRTNSASFRAMPDIADFLPPELATNEILRTVRQQVQATTALAANFPDNNNNNNNNNNPSDWQTIPEALLDPQIAAADMGKTPTSPEVLAALPREKLHEKSASFFHVALQVGPDNDTVVDSSAGTIYTDGCLTTGELGGLPLSSSKIKSAGSTSDAEDQTMVEIRGSLWTPSSRNQRTGKESWTQVDAPTSITPYIALLERGHGVSFYSKSILAQQTGASAVIIINDRSEPWPYSMKDSRSKSEKQATEQLTIPVVMMSQEKGQVLLQQVLRQQQRQKQEDEAAVIAVVTLTTRHTSHDAGGKTCVVCRESLALGQTSLTLTNYCGHTFHESCALQWLQHHNTCPYCRRSLPTTSGSNEAERRRVTTSQGGNVANEAFYS